MSKFKKVLSCTGTTVLLWGLARFVPALCLELSLVGSLGAVFLFLICLPIGWSVSQAVSKRRHPLCIRINLYIFASLEALGLLPTLLYLISDHIYSTGRYSSNSLGVPYSDYLTVYILPLILQVIYIALCCFLARITSAGVPMSSGDPLPLSEEDVPPEPPCPEPSPESEPPQSPSQVSAPSISSSPKQRSRPWLPITLICVLSVFLAISIAFNIYLSGSYDRGYKAGHTDGYSNGLQVGRSTGFEEGHSAGSEIGYMAGYASGRTDESLRSDIIGATSGEATGAYREGRRLGQLFAGSLDTAPESQYYEHGHYVATELASSVVSLDARKIYCFCTGYADGLAGHYNGDGLGFLYQSRVSALRSGIAAGLSEMFGEDILPGEFYNPG